MARQRKSILVDRVKTTAGNTFTAEITKSGRTIFRKNGRFTSARSAVAAASNKKHVREREIIATRYVNLNAPARTFEDMRYQDKKGVWRAGEDAPRYMPWIKAGDALSPREVQELGNIRLKERNYYAFSNVRSNRGKTADEIRQRYYDFLWALEHYDYDEVIAEYWDTSYGEAR